MIERTATIRNAQGIHCRPSAVIIKAFDRYTGVIQVSNGRGRTALHSVVELLGLGLAQGDSVAIRVSGPDEDKTCAEVVALFERVFDFPPRPGATGLAAFSTMDT